MTDGAFPDRLSQLKARWESDPSSRIFLQLAEEYRHQGRIKEALAVLDRGLQEHPGYLSALVAKGRCHIELGEAEGARSVLERVVKQDATQMVANKLLVRAYLETGDPARARERLDLYSLLNDSDPEIADLRRQIKQMERPKEQPPEDSLFDLGPLTAAPRPAARPAPDDIFDLGRGAAPAPARREVEDVFPLDEIAPPPSPAPEPMAALEPAVEAEEEAAGDGDLFPGLVSRATRERYLASLESEGIFEFGIAAAPPPAAAFVPPAPAVPPVFEPAPAVEPAVVDEDASWLEEIAPPEALSTEPEPVFEALPPLAPMAPAEEPATEELWPEEEPTAEMAPLPELPELEAEPEPEPEPLPQAAPEPLPELPPLRFQEPAPEPVATATLGELYLRQGHLDEAERIFREVLEREPDSGSARAGLGRLEEARRTAEPFASKPSLPEPLDARRLLAGFQPGRAGGGTTARKIFLLNRYLERLRGSRNVP